MKKKKLLKSSKSTPARVGSKPARVGSSMKSIQKGVATEDKLVSDAIGKVAINARKRAIYHKASYTIIKDGLIIKRSTSGKETQLGKVVKKRSKRISKTIRIK